MKLEFDGTETFYIVPETEFERNILRDEWFKSGIYVNEVDGGDENNIFISINKGPMEE